MTVILIWNVHLKGRNSDLGNLTEKYIRKQFKKLSLK